MFSHLFSIFDPSTSMNTNLNWLSIFLPMLLMPQIFWFKPSKSFIFTYMTFYYLYSELKKLMKAQNLNNSIVFMAIFFMFEMTDPLGMSPYNFTPTTHLAITLPISISIWLGIMLYGWTKKLNMMFAHMVPKGTPFLLMPLMVLIEFTSNIIRPGTLAVRLSTNLTAGHLIICLLTSANDSMSNYYLMMIVFIITFCLMIVEICVATIQSYVIMTLSSLYSNEF